ncbi:ester cyclase [Microbispora sp. RL4-1S]|uniref:Ester cyclase n=1 Tax=Microbispora oryzae TaxID=2806554 RepID=A0A940WDF1_9ACTN|nr:ester cyclase [Microbispora oryzae]MBP2702533.1 ester cyclase [Microbispora oryzae]
MSTFWDLKHRLCDAINAHDMQGVLDCYSPDAVYVTPSGVAEGRDQIAWLYEQIFTAFADFHAFAWFELADCDNPAVTEWTYTGTHTGPFLLPDGKEIEPTGRHIAIRATCTSHVEGGKITTHREYFDQLELYSQLGYGLTKLPDTADRACATDGGVRASAHRVRPRTVRRRRHARIGRNGSGEFDLYYDS